LVFAFESGGFRFLDRARRRRGRSVGGTERAVRERRRWRAVALRAVGLRGARARQSAEAARARARADRDDAAKWRRIVAGGIHLTITRVAPHAERRARPRGRAAAAARGEQAAGTSRFRARTWRREGCGYDLPSPRAWVFSSLHGWRSFGLRGVLIGRGAIWTREGFFARVETARPRRESGTRLVDRRPGRTATELRRV
jgi:hypothetical protein